MDFKEWDRTVDNLIIMLEQYRDSGDREKLEIILEIQDWIQNGGFY